MNNLKLILIVGLVLIADKIEPLSWLDLIPVLLMLALSWFGEDESKEVNVIVLEQLKEGEDER